MTALAWLLVAIVVIALIFVVASAQLSLRNIDKRDAESRARYHRRLKELGQW